jgi:hypothetical protein
MKCPIQKTENQLGGNSVCLPMTEGKPGYMLRKTGANYIILRDLSRSYLLKKLELDEWYSNKQKEHANLVYFLTKNVNLSVMKVYEISLLEFSHSKPKPEALYYCLNIKMFMKN